MQNKAAFIDQNEGSFVKSDYFYKCHFTIFRVNFMLIWVIFVHI